MTRRSVLDFSNYTGFNPDIPALVNAGWDGVILGTQNPSVTRRQYQVCQAGNLPVDALYVFVYWDAEDNRRLNDAITLGNELGKKVWLDCEWTKSGYPGSGWAPPPTQLVSLIHQYKDKLGALYAGIYTGEWWWPPYTGNSQEFARDLLWHAAYQAAEPDFNDFRPYGGWARPILWQYSSNGTQGINADLNTEETVAMPRVWLYGNEQAGAEVVGRQTFYWHLGVIIDKEGDEAGDFPGQRQHNEGGTFVIKEP